MKIPVNRHYCSLVTENVDSMCQTKTAGRGERGSLRPGELGGRWGWTTLQTKEGGSLRPRLWGDRRPCSGVLVNVKSRAGVHFRGPIPYRPQGIRGGLCRRVRAFLYPSCSEGSLFRTFMTKRKRIKIRWKRVHGGGWKCETWNYTFTDWKIKHKPLPVIGKICNCGMRKE